VTQSPAFLVIAPLLSAFVANLFGRRWPRVCVPVALVGFGCSLICGLRMCAEVVANGPIRYKLGGWDPPMGIEYVVDYLNAPVLVLISAVAMIAVCYSQPLLAELQGRLAHYMTLYILLVTGLLGITITGDAFNLYVLLEITSLTSYALLAAAGGRAVFSTFRYLIAGTIAASFYLLGVGYLYMKTGTLNMADLATRLPALSDSPAIMLAFTLIMIGIFIKMGFFPVHGWLPNAYTTASTPTACLVAPLMTKVSVYIMIRIMYNVFAPNFVFDTLAWQQIIIYLACGAILFGAFSALAQRDLRRMFTYIIVAEIGYMVGGAWLGNSLGLTGAIYHIVADGAMTLCLFLALGCVIRNTGGSKLENLRDGFARMPWTMGAFVIGGLAIIGLPPTCGFFSKWYLLSGAWEAGQYAFMAALLTSSLVNVVIFFRIIETAFFPAKGTDHDHHHEAPERKEAPALMLIPLWIVAISLPLLGLFSGDLIEALISHAAKLP
jgi:multicomponent Na+:H+ antiporter subunit D